jgi:hypothetical protein
LKGGKAVEYLSRKITVSNASVVKFAESQKSLLTKNTIEEKQEKQQMAATAATTHFSLKPLSIIFIFLIIFLLSIITIVYLTYSQKTSTSSSLTASSADASSSSSSSSSNHPNDFNLAEGESAEFIPAKNYESSHNSSAVSSSVFNEKLHHGQQSQKLIVNTED